MFLCVFECLCVSVSGVCDCLCVCLFVCLRVSVCGVCVWYVCEMCVVFVVSVW